MSLAFAPLLGLLQGLTEFLPISSSGHLVLAQALIAGFQQPGVVFDAALHLGTAMAVVWYERRQLVHWIRAAEGRHLLGLLALGTAATAVVAFPLRDAATAAFQRVPWVGVCLVVTGLVVVATRVMGEGAGDERSTTWRQAAVVGLVQGVAVFPGLSRSGLTIAVGLGAGLGRAWAARFSFLLSVPAVLGVSAVEVIAYRDQVTSAGAGFLVACAAGALAAGVSGYVALKIVVHTLSSRTFHRFAWYCLTIGGLVIALSLGRG